MAHLTIFNCGTGYNRDANDVVAELYRDADDTQHSVAVTDGVGSDMNLQGGQIHTLQAAGSGSVLGKFFAQGLGSNVDQMLEYRWKLCQADRTLTIDMLGWSRGAVTCFKIAYQLSRAEQL